jgi:hypothetical protein
MKRSIESYRQDIAPVTDLWPDMCHGGHRPKTHRMRSQLLASLGFKRCYVVVPPPGYVWFSSPFLGIAEAHNPYGHHGLDSILHGGEAMFDTIREAHRAGLEIFAIMKPYEGGTGHTIPDGALPPVPRVCIPQVGGIGVGYDVFLEDHPEMRVMRRPIANYESLVDQPVRSIEMVFCLDEVTQTAPGWKIQRFASQPDSVVVEQPVKDIRLWTSADNGTYEPYTSSFELTERLEERQLFDANGFALADGPSRCRVLTITGLAIPRERPYVAVELPDAEGELVTNPFSLITLNGELGEVPTTCTDSLRGTLKPGDAPGAKKPLRAFAELGFEFDWHGSGMWGRGWRASRVYGIARGKYRYMKGTHCEAYPEVREYWLDQIDRLIDMGVDGVDIRVQNHSAMISDWAHYGYNPPLVEAYREAHGVDITDHGADPEKLMRIRGEYFFEFLKETSSRLHAAGRTFQMHLRDGQEKPSLRSDHGHAGWWALPKIIMDWRKVTDLADEITIKDYNFGRYDRNIADGIKSRAHEAGKPVWVHCYIQQGPDLTPEFFSAVRRDERISGVLLYETILSKKYDLGILGIDECGEPFAHERTLSELERSLRPQAPGP